MGSIRTTTMSRVQVVDILTKDSEARARDIHRIEEVLEAMREERRGLDDQIAKTTRTLEAQIIVLEAVMDKKRLLQDNDDDLEDDLVQGELFEDFR